VFLGSITTSFTSPGEGETITVTARLEDRFGNVSDEGEDSASLASFDLSDETNPTVKILFEQPVVNGLTVLQVGQTQVRFEFSEPVQGFDLDDINLSIGELVNNSLVVDETDNSIWYATLSIIEADISAVDEGEISIESNRFTDLANNSNLTGDQADFRVFSQVQIEDEGLVDNFVPPIDFDNPSENSPNLVLQGTSLNDYIDGRLGDDVLYGLGGNDILIGFSGDDTLIGGEGDDILIGGSGDDFVFGNDGNDQYYAELFNDDSPQQNVFIGGEGFDTAHFDLTSEDYVLSFVTAEQQEHINDLLLADTDEGTESFGFRGVSVEHYDLFNTLQPVAMVSRPWVNDAGSTSYQHDIVQAETLAFSDRRFEFIDPLGLSTSRGTENNDVFVVAKLVDLGGSESELIDIEITEFELGKDVIDLVGIFSLNEDQSVDEDSDLTRLFGDLSWDEGTESIDIDLSAFVNDQGESLNYVLKVDFTSPMTSTTSSETLLSYNAFFQTDLWSVLDENLNN